MGPGSWWVVEADLVEQPLAKFPIDGGLDLVFDGRCPRRVQLPQYPISLQTLEFLLYTRVPDAGFVVDGGGGDGIIARSAERLHDLESVLVAEELAR